MVRKRTIGHSRDLSCSPGKEWGREWAAWLTSSRWYEVRLIVHQLSFIALCMIETRPIPHSRVCLRITTSSVPYCSTEGMTLMIIAKEWAPRLLFLCPVSTMKMGVIFRYERIISGDSNSQYAIQLEKCFQKSGRTSALAQRRPLQVCWYEIMGEYPCLSLCPCMHKFDLPSGQWCVYAPF